MCMKLRMLSLITLIAIGVILMTGCTGGGQKNSAFLSTPTPTGSTPTPSIPANMEEYNENLKQLWFSAGQQDKALSSVPEIDNSAVLVNGLTITKRTIEHQKNMQPIFYTKSLKDEIVQIVRQKVQNSEAIKQGIKPSQDDVDAYLKQEADSLNNQDPGMENILSYIAGMGITIDEYEQSQQQPIYDLYQRDALLKTLPTGTDTNKYVDGLVEKADIQILDPAVQVLFGGSQAMTSPPPASN